MTPTTGTDVLERSMTITPTPGSAAGQAPGVHFELFSTSFCGACRQTRMVLGRVLDLVPGSTLVEYDIAVDPERAEALAIEHSPTTIIRDGSGREISRATGVPSIPQVLVAAARTIDS
jgi:hypothetical protein